MLIHCHACNSKMRAPDSAAGKRVKCPKCAAIVRVPTTEAPDTDPEAAGVSSAPLPPAPPPVTVEPESANDDESTGTEVTASKPRAKTDDEPDGKARGRTREWDDEDDPEDFRDYDDLNVRRAGARNSINNFAMTGMVLGFVSLGIETGGLCCCGLIGAGAIGTVTGILGASCGYMGKVPGSENYAMTGLICGSIGAGLGLVELITGIAVIGLHFGMMN